MSKSYHRAKLSTFDFGVIRSPGPGLGNLLLPIARALIGAELTNGVFIFPTIRQVKIGTFLRGEPDKRTYFNELRGRGLHEWAHWFDSQRLPVAIEGETIDPLTPVTVEYEGLGRFFHDLSGYEALIRSWLEQSCKSTGGNSPTGSIAVHIRLGDFADSNTASNGFSVRAPFKWYLRALNLVLEMCGPSEAQNITVFTDSDHELIKKGLGIPGISFDKSTSATEAIMRMSTANYIITSRSTFSMWAAFLGNSTCIWHANIGLHNYYHVSERDIIIE